MADLDVILELLDGKMVTTDEGMFIKVDDLRQVVKEMNQMREEKKEAKPAPRSFSEATVRAKEDPEWSGSFEKLKKRSLVAPPEADLVKPVSEANEDAA